MEATSPEGIPQGLDHPGRQPRLRRPELRPGRLHLLLPERAAVRQRGRRHLVVLPGHACRPTCGAIQAPSDTLGWGAGIATPATGNYFPPGTTPVVDATFDAWWAPQAGHLELAYSVENDASLTAETVPAPTVVPLPTNATDLADMPLTLPAARHRARPLRGPGQPARHRRPPRPPRSGTTCMPYTVGATGDNLDFATLPAGVGLGRPGRPPGRGPQRPARPVGPAQPHHRRLEHAAARTATPRPRRRRPAGPSAMTFTSASTDPYKAACLANQDHVAYWIQVSGGDAVPTALVARRVWQGDMAALVAHYATVPVGLRQLRPGDGLGAVERVEQHRAGPTAAPTPPRCSSPSTRPSSRSSRASARRSSAAPPSGFGRVVAAADRRRRPGRMDVAAIHPYTGSNDSYDEDGSPAQVRQVQGLLGGQAAVVHRGGLVERRRLRLPVPGRQHGQLAGVAEGARACRSRTTSSTRASWGNDGVSFSLIQTASGDDYVKPAALTTMTTIRLLAGRPYVSMPATGIPHTYQADFGPTSGGSTDLAAVWSDGLPVTATVTLTSPGGSTDPVTVTSEYGATTTVQATSGTAYSLPLSGQVTYLTYPAGDTLEVGPTEAYGTDVASPAAGATPPPRAAPPRGHQRPAGRLRRLDVGQRRHHPAA